MEEAVSLFHKFVGKNLTEDLVIRILEAYVPMKIQIRQEEVWASQFQRNKACIGTQRMHRLDAGHSDYQFMCKACGTGWPEAAKQCWVCPGKEFVPSRHPRLPMRRTASLTTVEGKPTWIQQREGGSLGATGPGGTRAQADRNLVDGTVLGRAPPKTDTAEEIAMADVVPLNRRVDIRQEILSAGGRRGVEGPGVPGDQGQSAAVPEGGGGSELPALPPPGGPSDLEEGGAA